MGERRRRRVADPDERLRSDSGAGRNVAREVGGAGSLGDHVLGLQRDYGNAAVTTIVQRAPRERPASQNVKDLYKPKKGKPAPKPKPKPKTEAELYLPTASNTETFPSKHWPSTRNQDLLAIGNRMANETVRNSWLGATEHLEEYWFWTKDTKVGHPLYKAYKALGDTKRAMFWIEVANTKGASLTKQ